MLFLLIFFKNCVSIQLLFPMKNYDIKHFRYLCHQDYHPRGKQQQYISLQSAGPYSIRKLKNRSMTSQKELRKYASDKIDFKVRLKPKAQKRNSELISTLFLLNPSVRKMIKSG